MFRLTAKQTEANELLGGPAQHVLLFGGSRSGKTFLICRAIAFRAMAAPGSRHVILRYRFNAVRESVAMDTFPRMMKLCWPKIECRLNKQDWFFEMPGGSEVWVGGLDEKERTEKILGKEFVTLFFNEASQIPYDSYETARTRLAQNVNVQFDQQSPRPMRLKAFYDENPPDRGHWTYRMFVQKIDPITRKPLPSPNSYAALKVNPGDNIENLPANYISDVLGEMSERMQRRFLLGEFRDENPAALFVQEYLDRWRTRDELPDMVRVVVAVDPSGSGDVDNADNDAIGIVVAGLGTDGNGYLLEDLTVKAGPATWGRVATSAFDRHKADVIVAEVNFGGAMVQQVIQAARPRTPFRAVTASRGKIARAEPVAALVEKGKVRLAGSFAALEDELAGFTTSGYIGERSPNRADAFVWAFAALFPGIVKPKVEPRSEPARVYSPTSWMAS